jgi:hypothetical protein
MAEVTITSESGLYKLERGGGRGCMKIAGFQVPVTDGETLDTGFDTVEGICGIDVEATDIDANSILTFVKSISGGVITFLNGAIGAYGDGTDGVCWLIVMGRVN